MQSRIRRAAGVAALCFFAYSPIHAAGIAVPAGASVQTNGGAIDTAGGSLLVDGYFALGGGTLSGLDAVRIALGGVADFGSGLATLSGDWENRGTFTAGSSRVQLRDGLAAASAILGTSQFASLSLVSASGKRYRFESGRTQSVTGTLQITGNGPPIQVDVTTSGTVAFLNLATGGTQVIANVGVSDVHATGQHLAPTQLNQGGSGNAQGWFGGGVPTTPPVPVPAVSPLALAALIAAFVLVGLRRTARRAARS